MVATRRAAASSLNVDIGDADVADLPLALELDERAYGVIERHARVGAVQLVEINPVGAQALEASGLRWHHATFERQNVATERESRCELG
jgi:hypothetical protein